MKNFTEAAVLAAALFTLILPSLNAYLARNRERDEIKKDVETEKK